MSKHTRGPWTTQFTGDRKVILIVEPDIEVDHDDVDLEEAQANARLIAAAPEMRDELAEAALQIEYLHGKFQKTGTGNAALDRINRLIAKIDGAP